MRQRRSVSLLNLVMKLDGQAHDDRGSVKRVDAVKRGLSCRTLLTEALVRSHRDATAECWMLTFTPVREISSLTLPPRA